MHSDLIRPTTVLKGVEMLPHSPSGDKMSAGRLLSETGCFPQALPLLYPQCHFGQTEPGTRKPNFQNLCKSILVRDQNLICMWIKPASFLLPHPKLEKHHNPESKC